MATYIEIGNFLLWPPSYPSWVSGGRTYWWLGSYSCRSASQHVSLLQSEWHPDVLTADPDYVDRWVDASLYRGVQKSSTYRMWLTVTPLLNLCASLLLMMSFRSMENTAGDGASYLYLPRLRGCLGVGLQRFLYYDFSVLLAGFHVFTNQ